jgi:hypothetical protein
VIPINFEVDDTDEQRSLVLKNGVINSRSVLDANPDLTIAGTGLAINAVLMGGDPAAGDA